MAREENIALAAQPLAWRRAGDTANPRNKAPDPLGTKLTTTNNQPPSHHTPKLLHALDQHHTPSSENDAPNPSYPMPTPPQLFYHDSR